ncbi:MAG TPA: DUF6364 family protein [Candidatus Brocadiia bacterium]|nr:DUF6364 family protein [Candidatus Brocadiia bacterium]
MEKKLILRVDEKLARKAKAEARRRGKTVSQMVSGYFRSLDAAGETGVDLPPITAALAGILKGKSVNEEDYKSHLREKHR